MGERVSPARTAAAWVLSRCGRFDAWSSQTLQAARDKFSLSDKDAALCARLCLSVLQNAALCDFYIDSYSSTPTEKMEPAVLDILRLGTVQLLFLDRIPVSAAVDQSVEMAKNASRRSAGLVNAVLRRIAGNRDALPEIPEKGRAKELSVRYSHPLWFCRQLTGEFGHDFARAVLEANNASPGLTLSVNLCRTDAVSLAEKLVSHGIEAHVHPFSPVSVEVRSGVAVNSLPGFAEGEFFVQDAAAAGAVLAAAPQKGSRVLDLCAAPGGKSLLCASLMHGEGEIISCDLHANKLRLIENNARRMGFPCIAARQMDAAQPDESYFSAFDLVIADVPCSGFGVIRKKPEIRYKSPESLRALPEVQLRILQGASSCVRPGGNLLYATCTVFHEENDQVVSAFLSEHPEYEVTSSRLLWPQEYGTDGFFYCVMRKDV